MSHLRKTWNTAALTSSERVRPTRYDEEEQDRRTERHEETHSCAEQVLQTATTDLEEAEEEEWGKERNERRRVDGDNLLAQGIRKLRVHDLPVSEVHGKGPAGRGVGPVDPKTQRAHERHRDQVEPVQPNPWQEAESRRRADTRGVGVEGALVEHGGRAQVVVGGKAVRVEPDFIETRGWSVSGYVIASSLRVAEGLIMGLAVGKGRHVSTMTLQWA